MSGHCIGTYPDSKSLDIRTLFAKDRYAKFKEELKATIKEIIDDLGLATKEDLEKLKEDLK